MKKLFILSCALLLACPLYAAGPRYDDDAGQLTSQQVERVKACRHLLAEVDTKSLTAMIRDLEQSDAPEANLQLLEAVAAAYAQIVTDRQVTEQKNKDWLYSMVKLNMAFLQFGGSENNVGGNQPLNRLICHELKKHLSPEILQDPKIFHSLEDE